MAANISQYINRCNNQGCKSQWISARINQLKYTEVPEAVFVHLVVGNVNWQNKFLHNLLDICHSCLQKNKNFVSI